MQLANTTLLIRESCFPSLSVELMTDSNASIVSDNSQWPPRVLLPYQIAKEVDVLLWSFPPGVTSAWTRTSAAASLVPVTAFTTALCPHPSCLRPRLGATVLSFHSLAWAAGGPGPLCVVRMEGKGCGLPKDLANSRGRRRLAAVWLLTSCGADGAPALPNTRGFHCLWNLKNM